MKPRTEEYRTKLHEIQSADAAEKKSVTDVFPFREYFADAPQPLFSGDMSGDNDSPSC